MCTTPLHLPQVKDPEKFDFDPKKLLASICSLYNNLARADRGGAFARAVADDARSYRGAMFPEAALVLRQFQLMPENEARRRRRPRGAGLGARGAPPTVRSRPVQTAHAHAPLPPLPPRAQVQQLDALAARVAQAKARAAAADDPLGDPPEEFLDPVVYTLMRDPVVSPASGTTYDRAVIRRHLLTDARDPLNREALSPYDLKPDSALKARRAARGGGGGGGGAAARRGRGRGRGGRACGATRARMRH